MTVQQQSAQIEQLLAGQPDGRKTLLCQQLQNQLRVAPVVLLLAGFRRANLRRMADPALDSQLLHQVQKPRHRSAGFDAYQRGPRQTGIELPHLVAFVHQGHSPHFSGGRVQHRHRLLASVQIASYNSHSASFGPSAVRVNAETVYSGRCEAGFVMTSTGHL
jgi:hypothetical protein